MATLSTVNSASKNDDVVKHVLGVVAVVAAHEEQQKLDTVVSMSPTHAIALVHEQPLVPTVHGHAK
jgi:hypothetical protein